MGNIIKNEYYNTINEHYESIKSECKNNLKDRNKLINILKREWITICISWNENNFSFHQFTPIGYIINALDIQELTEEYTKFLTKFNCNNLSDFDFDNFTEYIVKNILV